MLSFQLLEMADSLVRFRGKNQSIKPQEEQMQLFQLTNIKQKRRGMGELNW